MRFIIAITFFLAFLSGYTQNPDQPVNQTDENGLKQGRWMKYHEGDSVIKYEGQFIDDKPVGIFTHYYSNGEIRVILEHGKDDVSRVTNYWPGGNIMGQGKYIKQEKDSTWQYFDQFANKISEEYYIEGSKYGNWKVYYPTGMIMEERYFENSLENGPFKQYYETGILYREATYVDGGQEGLVTFYHENSKVRAQGIYFKDVKNGTWSEYDEEGNEVKVRNYKNGVCLDCQDDGIVIEDSSMYYRKDEFTIEDVVGEDMNKIPTKKEEKDSKKKK